MKLAPRTIPELFAERARLQPASPAFVRADGATTSSLDAHRHVLDVVDALEGAGVGPGERIAVALAEGPDASLDILAVACHGEAAPLDPDLTQAEALRLLRRLLPRRLLAGDGPAANAASELGLSRLHAIGPGCGARRDAPGTTEDSRALLLPTSGTEGGAHLVRLTHRNLLASAQAGAAALGLGPSDRCLDLRPGHHASSLVGAVLASLVAGGAVIRPGRFSADGFFDWLDRLRPTWYTAAPALHAAIVVEARRRGPCRTALRFIRSSAAPLDPELARELTRLFGVPVVPGYGMTEAPLIASLPIEAAGRGLGPGEVGLAAGIEIALRDDEVWVRGPGVSPGYEGEPDACAEAFVEGWFRTGDLGALDAAGRLVLRGRRRERINRGGEKVDPVEVEAILRNHPAVADAAVVGVPHPRLGEEVAAAVVRRPGAAVSVPDLRLHVAASLSTFKVPRRIVFVETLPRDPQGKLRRRSLAASLPAPAPRPAPRRPLAPDERRIASVWAEVLGIDSVAPGDDFFDLGGDSLAAVAILARLQAEPGARLDPAVFFEAPTVAALAAALAGVPSRSTGPLVALRSGGARPPFYCVHGVDGLAFRLKPLALRLPSDQPFLAFQAVGSNGREPPLDDVGRMAEAYLEALPERVASEVLLLGGFCAGAAVAFEMACRLEARGRPVTLLALIDPPPLPLAFRRSTARRLDVILRAGWARLRGREAGPLIEPDEPEVMRSHRRAIRRYRPAPYPGRPHAFFAASAPEGSAEDALASLRRLARGGVEPHFVPGGHMDMMFEPGVARLADELDAAIRCALANLR